ncbi:MAG TPA: DUF1918 domain-containing protein [Streptosporangiaceae bacterium]|nr:DUF1918 domain-containing protein [Streptosporangiaceae bacterium]
MKAKVGDRLVIDGTNLGDRRRVGIVTGVGHPDGSPPYTVRWLEDNHESLVFPGPAARVESKLTTGSAS